MKKALRAAIVGCGRIGTYTRPELLAEMHSGFLPYNHAEAILANPELSLSALCDTSQENLTRASQHHKVSAVFQDYQKLISETRPDIITIGTRTPIKAEIMDFAMRNGVRGIHVEKPLANCMRVTRQLLALAKEKKVLLTYGTTRRFMDIYRLAKELVDKGTIGKLLQVEVRSGRTQLLWNHPHSSDLLLFLSGGGRAEFVQATCTMPYYAENSLQIDEDPVVENAYIKFSNGIIGIISAIPGNDVVIYGSEATLTIAADSRWIEISKTQINGNSATRKTEKVDVTPEMSGTKRALRELARGLLFGEKIGIAPSDIASGQELLFLTALSSLKGGARVSPDELAEDFTLLGKTSGLSA